MPRTLVSLRAPLYAFAQDGGRIAWMAGGGPCDVTVRLRSLATGNETTLTRPHGATCTELQTVGGPTHVLALAGNQALWGVFTQSNESDSVAVVTGMPGRADVAIDAIEFTGGLNNNPSAVPPSFAASGSDSTLVYARTGDEGSGEVWRAVGGRSQRVDDLAGVGALAVDGSRLAAAASTFAGSAVSDDPAWSPTAKLIAFRSKRGGSEGIYLINSDGKGTRQLALASSQTFEGEPAWSPDGKRLAFTKENGGVFVMNADGRGQKLVPGTSAGGAPAWSADGTLIAYETDDGIHVVHPDGSGRRRILTNPNDEVGVFVHPAFSPDDLRLAFGDNRSGKVAVASATGRGLKELGFGRQPAWSPDGKRLAVSADCAIKLMDPLTGTLTGLTKPPPKVCDEDPSWSADGGSIVFARRVSETESELYVVVPDGTEPHRLTKTVAASPLDSVEVRAVGGASLRRITALRAVAVALSRSTLAALTRRGSRKLIAIYDARSGKLLRTVGVPAATAPELSLAGHRLVFRVGRSIELLDTRGGGTRRLLARAAATPLGLSIEGTRVAWGENLGRSGRIRAITLPRTG